ncbi:Magnesium transporter MgtE [Gemmata obscuriglobus]|uniref:Magnesium transporter n=1 Tax=Gemmata obscuriglobus TaxID=114 RepID=A0A2Z3GWE7_9BACT|nr:magnesium transporter [Gemmata obscuriglobus]AWM36412.1 magnesium transporter [Gemmata obscuriglobus]QEG30972.1 Magnesium transporter MgtE [Gemmata obscuriglobus]VTS10305.1 magnesium transporter : CBS domain containing protein OS=Pedosphaera parvula (strain Ellin514) GN=Cflav_PD3954 PE=4 SV=1: CBS: CBS: MgtE [Gemmata obscuriglobus UQM 2246]
MSDARQILADPVTKHMRTDPTRIESGASVAQALDYIRDHEIGGRVVYFYVVDGDGRLVGVVPTRRLLRARPEAPVLQVMISPVVAVPHTASVLDACEFFTLHKLLAFPVIDADGKLIGLVDVDLYTDELADLERRQEGQDLFELVGVHLTEAEQRRALYAARKRFPWLMCNVIGGMIAALIADAYADVSTLILVAPFIALVTGMAEGVAIQSVSLALQTMHGRRPTWGALGRRVGREVLVGLLLGAFCGLIVGLVALLWKGSARAGLSLCVGIAGGVAASAAVGLALPFLLRMARRDPQVASGPVALAAADMVTLLLYFNLGRWLLV